MVRPSKRRLVGSMPVIADFKPRGIPMRDLQEVYLPLDGLEAVREIRTRQVKEGWPHVPVLAFTSNKRDGDEEKCLAAGMDDYLPKEIFMPKWRQTLREKLERWMNV